MNIGLINVFTASLNYDIKMEKPHWAKRISLEGAALEENRKYNRSNIHCEKIHPDRFRFHHEIMSNGKLEKFNCGTKYDPNDTRMCPFCIGYELNRSEEDVLRVAYHIFSIPRIFTLEEIVDLWWSQGDSFPEMRY